MDICSNKGLIHYLNQKGKFSSYPITGIQITDIDPFNMDLLQQNILYAREQLKYAMNSVYGATGVPQELLQNNDPINDFIINPCTSILTDNSPTTMKILKTRYANSVVNHNYYSTINVNNNYE